MPNRVGSHSTVRSFNTPEAEPLGVTISELFEPFHAGGSWRIGFSNRVGGRIAAEMRVTETTDVRAKQIGTDISREF